jgi:glycine/D-amino acid oxidase-like deaminating enzyme
MPETSVGWDDDHRVRVRLQLPQLTADVTADVCVVGLGGSGLAAVAECLRRGLSVVGIDAGRVGEGAAGRNGGFLLAGPSDAIHASAESLGTEVALDLYRQTVAELNGLREALGEEIVRPVGSIRLAGLPGEPATAAEAADRDQEIADCARQFGFMRANGLPVELYEGPLGHGLFFPHDAAMNPALRVLRLAEICQAAGARLFEQTRALHVANGRAVTAHGQVSASAVIVAVDGRLEVLLPELAYQVRTARLQMLSTAPLADPQRLPCPVYGRWGYDYAQQDPSGAIFVGGGRDLYAEQEWTGSSEPTIGVQNYLHHIAERFAGAPVTVANQWAASVGFTDDGRPLVTQARPGVFACGGYNGTGNLVGPIAARAALALALDGTPPSPFFATVGTLSA